MSTSTKRIGRPRVREGLEHKFLTPPSVYGYNCGCKCDGCKDEKCLANQASRDRIAAANEELWAHIAQIRERMALTA